MNCNLILVKSYNNSLVDKSCSDLLRPSSTIRQLPCTVGIVAADTTTKASKFATAPTKESQLSNY